MKEREGDRLVGELSVTCHRILDMSNLLSKEGIIIVYRAYSRLYHLGYGDRKLKYLVLLNLNEGGEKNYTCTKVFYFFRFKHSLGS